MTIYYDFCAVNIDREYFRELLGVICQVPAVRRKEPQKPGLYTDFMQIYESISLKSITPYIAKTFIHLDMIFNSELNHIAVFFNKIQGKIDHNYIYFLCKF